jgi:predicted GIY-YIG superfamily endonuclease
MCFINKKKKAGVYSFFLRSMNTNGKQYIGSAKDLYLRLNEHFVYFYFCSCGA